MRKSGGIGRTDQVMAASVLILLLTVTGFMIGRAGDRRDPMASLVIASTSLAYRPVAARLSGGFPYKSLRATRGTDDRAGSSTERWKLFAAADEVRARASVSRSVKNLHCLGVAYLLVGAHAEAVRTLEHAVMEDARAASVLDAIRESRDAVLLSDLSAAYYERSLTTEDARDRLSAVETSERAWRLSRSPEIAWNRALALEALGLPDDARAMWQEHLRRDSTSDWAREAAERLELLRIPTLSERWNTEERHFAAAVSASDTARLADAARRFPLETRTYLEETLLPEWGARVLKGDTTGAEQLLQAATAVASAHRMRSGEALLSDVVSTIRRSPASQVLARGHVAYGKGRAHHRANELAAARLDLQDAERLLASARSPMAHLATIFLASCAYYESDYDGALLLTSRVSEAVQSKPHFSARGLTHWISGISESSKGNVHAAVAHYEQASDAFSRLGETDNVLAITGLLATTHDTIGDGDGGWAFRIEALRMLRAVGSGSRRIAQTLFGAAVAAHRDGYVLASIVFLNRELAVTDDVNAADLRAFILARRSELERILGDTERASSDLQSAQVTAGRIRDDAVRTFTTTHPDFIRATLAAVSSREERISAIRTAYVFAAKTGNVYRQVELLLAEAREESAAGNISRAASMLDRVLQKIESERSRLPDLALREAHLEQRVSIYRELVKLSLQRRESNAAFGYAERSRARSVREAFEGSLELEDFQFESIRVRIPADTAMIYYVALEDRLLTWVISRSQATLKEIVCPAKDLPRASNARAAAILVAPWIEDVGNFTTLVIVPDDPLHNVAFASLRAGGQYLLERYRLVISPSAVLYLRCSERAREVATADAGGLLLISAGGAVAGGSFSALPRVKTEIAAIHAVSPRATVLQDPQVTKGDFFRNASVSRMVYFAGHGVANDAKPAYSALVLPHGSNGPAEYVYAHEIAAQRFSATGLVVLSACDSLRSGARAQNGISSIGRAFIAGGVPTVVGTLRAVDDDVAARVFGTFYARVSAGDDPATALRTAQLQALRQFGHRDWDAFYIAGGVA